MTVNDLKALSLDDLHEVFIGNPVIDFAKRMKLGAYEGWSDDKIEAEMRDAEILAGLWKGAPSISVKELIRNYLKMIRYMA